MSSVLDEYVKVRATKQQSKKGRQKVKIGFIAFFATLAISSSMMGCMQSQPADIYSPEVPQSSISISVGGEESTVESSTDIKVTQNEFDRDGYRTFIENLIKTYETNPDDIKESDIAEFVKQLSDFSDTVNADLESGDDNILSSDKQLLILSNQFSDITNSASDEVKTSMKESDTVLLDLSSSLKVAKKISVDNISMKVGDTLKVKVAVLPENADTKYSYKLSSNTIATIDGGTITAKDTGLVTLMVTEQNTGVSASARISISKATGSGAASDDKSTTDKVSSTGNSVDNKGSSGSKSSSSNKSSSGNSSQSSKPSNSNSAHQSSQSPQSSKPSSSSQQQSKPATPSSISVTGISLSHSTITMTEGDTFRLTATISPSNATNKNVTWSWNNGHVSMDSDGTIHAKSSGTSVITVKSKDGGYTATCTVTVKAKQQQSSKPSQPSQPSQPSKPSSGSSQSSKPSKPSSGSSQSSKPSSSTGKPWVASDHKAVKSQGGYTMYEVPEILQYVNYYRRQAGVSELVWLGADEAAVKAEFNSLPQKKQDIVRANSPECFDKSGNLIVSKYLEPSFMQTRNALEYCMTTHSLNHGNNYGGSPAAINGSNPYYDPEDWIASMKSSPAHWEILMSKDWTSLYVVCYQHPEGGFTFCIN